MKSNLVYILQNNRKEMQMKLKTQLKEKTKQARITILSHYHLHPFCVPVFFMKNKQAHIAHPTIPIFLSFVFNYMRLNFYF